MLGTPANEATQTPARVGYIDVAKGIGILLVVFGHSRPLRDGGELFRVVFSFHVALFFLLSGVFFKPSRSLRETVTTRASALLKPYLVTQLALSVDDLLVDRNREPLAYFVAMLSGNGSVIRWTPMWFLPHLFAVSVFAWVVCRATRLESRPEWARALGLGAMLSVGALTVKAFYWPVIEVGETKVLGLPWSVDVVLVSGAFFLAGFAFRRRVLALEWKLLPVLAAVVVFTLTHVLFAYTMDLNMRRYDNLFVCTLAAAAGIYVTLAVSRLVAETAALSRPLAYVGSASVFVLVFHAFPQERVSDIVERRIPGHDAIAAGVAFVAAVLVPLFVYEVAKRVKPVGMLYLPKGARTGATSRSVRERSGSGA